MPVTIELPQVGESTVEGVIVRWLKKPGDHVARYEPLVEVETDKVSMEVPSPVAGTLLRTIANEGDKVPMGAPICEMEEEKGAPAASGPAPGTIGTLQEPGPGFGATGATPEQPDSAQPARHLRLSPVVQKLAEEHHLSLQEMTSIRGTGLEGRITKQDVLAHIERREGRATPAPAAPSDGARAQTVPTAPSPQVAAPAPTPQPAVPAPRAVSTQDEERVPLTAVRRRTAENMMRSTKDIPTAWTMNEVDVTNLVRWRRAVKDEFQRTEGVDLTYLPFILKAVTEAVRQHPKVNSSWGGDAIILKKRINIGIPVAASYGLVVPVIRDADSYSIAGLARVLQDLVAKARDNRLTLPDVQGGTFTLNNTGALGAVLSHPILIYPQTANLTMEAIVRRPVVINDGIAIRDIMNTAIVFDHRTLDGHEAGGFLTTVKRLLEGMGPERSLY